MTGYEPPTALPRAILDRPDMREALAAHDFGTVFRLARRHAGVSYSKIAAECDIKPERVGTLARGQGSVTTFCKIVEIADALRIPSALVGLASRPWEASESPPAPPHAGTKEIGTDVQRRNFLRATTGTLAVGFPSITRPAMGNRLGARDPQRLRARAARLRRLDHVLGGGDTYRVYLGEYQETTRLLRESSYAADTGRAMLSVLAEQAQQAGWAAFDGGREADAKGLYQESYKAATDAGDADLAGNALAFLSYQAVSGDRRAGVDIASRSCETVGPEAPSGVRALLYERKAWACAVAGLASETERALADAKEALDGTGSEPQPDWVAWVDATELQIMTGRCWAELHRPLRAVPALEAGLAQYDDSHARDKALYLSWLADAYLSAGEVEQSAAVVKHALDLSDGVASVRPHRRLSTVLRRLGEHRNVPAVTVLLGQSAP
ncbi:XRE family transcriptional regulator [Streptomyces sp. NBC_01497]|uniref:XRE family transcriptional regulator n=1 Tax=Streptomyces sp. NBC_01497 TaxID=2903885 RepID=UPI002E34E34B|nr:XRE family transcriptional regulator [Streptomyces sp. NBC_01497]